MTRTVRTAKKSGPGMNRAGFFHIFARPNPFDVLRNLLCKAALLLLLAPLAGPQRAAAQGYVKLNAL